MALAAFRPVSGPFCTVNMKAGAAAISEGELLILSSNTVVTATDGATVFGVAAASFAAGTYGPVHTMGVFEGYADTGVNFGHGAHVYAAGSDKLDAGSATNLSCGVVVNNDPASAGLVQFILHSSAHNQLAAS